RQRDRGRVPASQSNLAPGSEQRIGGNIGHDTDPVFADGSARGTTPRGGVGPPDFHAGEISFFVTGISHRAYKPFGIRLGVANPREPIRSDTHNDVADLPQQNLFATRLG